MGNAIYYFSLVPHLPAVLRHQGFLLDWGSLVDFVVCLGVYGLIRLARRCEFPGVANTLQTIYFAEMRDAASLREVYSRFV